MTMTRHSDGGFKTPPSVVSPWAFAHASAALGVVLVAVTPAHAQEGNQPVSMRMSGPPAAAQDLARLFPADVPILFVAPRMARVLADLARLNRLLSPMHPEWGPGGLTNALFERAMTRFGGTSGLLPEASDRKRSLKALLTKDGLVDAGIDPLGQIVFAPDFDARVLMLAVELVDRPQFERWLARMGGADRRRIDMAGELATVIGPRTDTPVTCLARRAYALCQISAPDAGDPILPLRRLAALRGPRLGGARERNEPGLWRHVRAIPRGAHVYAVGSTKELAPRLAKLVAEWEGRASRFSQPKRRKAALVQAARLKKKIEAASALTDGVSVGMFARRRGLEFQWQAHLTSLGRELLSWWLPDGPQDDVIARWTRTPAALMRLAARTKPELIESVAMTFGWSPPKGALTGDIGLLSLGLDSICDLSQRGSATGPVGDSTYWGFVFPTAVSLGVRSTAAADRVQKSMQGLMEADHEFDLPDQLSRPRPQTVLGAAPVSRQRLRGSFQKSPFKVQVFDQLMVLGLGPGTVSAGVRRLGALPPRRIDRRPRKMRRFLEVSLNPRAIDAAFAAAQVGPDHRDDLRALEAWRMRWHPLLTRLREVRLSGNLDTGNSRLVLVGSIIE